MVTKENISGDYKQLNYVEELKKLKEYLDTLEYIGNNEKVFYHI